ncbi:MAG: hypothetical protein EOO33_04070 [Comamonadaceae bacterium]|nr:MAG: hypothetical protein EOO33_04070 [Comamonadaceae bacterium]
MMAAPLPALPAQASQTWRHAQRMLPAVTGPALSRAEAQRVQHYHDRLMQALQTRDQAALRQTKQEVLRAVYARCLPATPPLRQALRRLSVLMAGLRLPRHTPW